MSVNDEPKRGATSSVTMGSKDLVVFVPLAGAITALSWETGSFVPIGGHAFENFILAEHFAFALPAFPIAIVLILVGSIQWMVIRPDKKTDRKPGAKGHPMDVFLLIIATNNLFFGLYHHQFSFVWLAIGMVAFVVFLRERPKAIRDFPTATLLSAIGLLQITTFLVAIDWTRYELKSANNLQRVELDQTTRNVAEGCGRGDRERVWILQIGCRSSPRSVAARKAAVDQV